LSRKKNHGLVPLAARKTAVVQGRPGGKLNVPFGGTRGNEEETGMEGVLLIAINPEGRRHMTIPKKTRERSQE